MSRPRFLLPLRAGCPCCRARARLARLTETCERIEDLADGAIEFCVPSADRLVDGEREVKLFLCADLDPATVDDDLAGHTVTQLRALSRELAAAADAVEGGAA